MKNKIDHCTGSGCPLDMKICVKILMGYPITMKQSQGCCQARGEKTNPGRGGEGAGPSREVDTKMSQIDSRLRLQMQVSILNGGKATGIFVEIIRREFSMNTWILKCFVFENVSKLILDEGFRGRELVPPFQIENATPTKALELLKPSGNMFSRRRKKSAKSGPGGFSA